MKVTLLGMMAILGVTAAAVLVFLVTRRPGGGSVVAEN
jgi:hypothetical protein